MAWLAAPVPAEEAPAAAPGPATASGNRPPSTTKPAIAEGKAPATVPITLINVFEVPAEEVEEFIARWRTRAKVMAAAPGFRDARLHRAASSQARFRLVNVAHWDSTADLEAAFGRGPFQDNLTALREDSKFQFSANPAVYHVVAELGGP